ncbi:MAG TPA: type II secretion system inner membrane protein GspF [Polyangiaceae bacterium]|jgi:general secretion pathway protein F|nr:type II secretion system inner membrane protein GspF [Polyangiaceae bacterium]
MAIFQYTGVEIASGKVTKGFRDADNSKSLRALLRRDGVMLTSAEEDTHAQVREKRDLRPLAFLARASTTDVAVMTRQLATLVRAGIPLVEAISALIDQVEKEVLVKVLSALREGLKEGTSFARCLEQHPRVFPPLYINMVAAGESSGTLENVLERLADFMEKQAQLKSKVRAALTYPVLLTMIALALVGVLMVAVVPKVTAIFDSMGQELPWYTKLLIFVSNTLANFWWLLILLVVGLVYAFRRYTSTPKGRMALDRFLLRVPIFGRLNMLVAVARFSSTMATLLASGVPLLKAMEIVRNVLGNVELEEVVTNAIGSIREGESIAEPLKRSGRFPPMVTHMIAVGERSGQLEQMLENVSAAYEADVTTRVAMLTALLEPMIIVTMGGMVFFIAVAILMPLMQMSQMVD